MTPDTVIQRLEREEETARAEMTALQERLVALEERLAALSVTRRMLTELFDAPPGADETSSAEAPGSEKEPSPSKKHSESGKAKQAGPHKTQGTPRGAVSQKIVTLIVSADRPLRAREVTIALGRSAPSRSQVEAIRRTCRKLAAAGHLQVLGTGEFTGTEGAA
ncbi:hypothetical protein [Streptomyces celluloflavus]|uniref:hypothetical protein n=1 Tax=Streptomyces celluloflavus TaxID=58344 RepID=UPI003650AF05